MKLHNIIPTLSRFLFTLVIGVLVLLTAAFADALPLLQESGITTLPNTVMDENTSKYTLTFTPSVKLQEPEDGTVVLYNWSYSLSGKVYSTAGISLAENVWDVKNLNFNFLGGLETSNGSIPTLGLGFSYQTTWNRVKGGVGLNVHFTQNSKIDVSIGFNLSLNPY